MPESNTPPAPQKAADQSALTGLTKRQQLKKTNQNIFIWVTIAAVVLAFSVVALQFLVRQGLFNAKIIEEQQKTSRALDESKKNFDGLKKNVDGLLADARGGLDGGGGQDGAVGERTGAVGVGAGRADASGEAGRPGSGEHRQRNDGGRSVKSAGTRHVALSPWSHWCHDAPSGHLHTSSTKNCHSKLRAGHLCANPQPGVSWCAPTGIPLRPCVTMTR